MSAVHFRFQTGNQQFTTVQFEGEQIKLFDLKKVIVEKKKFMSGSDLELVITNCATQQGIVDV